MNHTCQLLGHEWGKWKWSGGCSNKYTPTKGDLGPVHSEIRKCQRQVCDELEVQDDLPGKYTMDFWEDHPNFIERGW